MNRSPRLAALLAVLGFTVMPYGAAEKAASADSDKLGERSLYLLDSSWTDDSGRPVQLRELAGEVQILTLMFTTCTGSCPVTVKALQMFARKMPADIKEHARFLLVTVDPQRDGVAELRRYRQEMKLDQKRWRLLRGSPEDVRELAAVLGFNYEQIESGQYVHSNLVTVLDPRGQIVHQQSGTTGTPEGLLDAIHQALSAQASSTHSSSTHSSSADSSRPH